MQKYIALLRGINVGGKNKIPMPELKAAFENSGFTAVSTYINSGNVFFSSKSHDEGEIKKICEDFIAERFGFFISTMIISVSDLREALQNAPDWWNADRQSKHNAIFVIPPATAEDIFEQVGDSKPEYEWTGAYGRVIFWSAPIETFSKTRWSKIVGTSAYGSITIRNANTAKKLLQLAEL